MVLAKAFPPSWSYVSIAHHQGVKKEILSVQGLGLKNTKYLQTHPGNSPVPTAAKTGHVTLQQFTAKPQTRTQKLRPYPSYQANIQKQLLPV